MRALQSGLRAIMTLCATGLLFSGIKAPASFSPPYTNTFDTADRSNDFVYGMSPIERSSNVTWTVTLGEHKNILDESKAQRKLFGWATLDFSGPDGIDASHHDFNMAAKFKGRHSSSTTTNYSGGYQGFCALATDTNLTDYYYGSFIFTNVYGTLQITKITGGVVGLAATQSLAIAFDRNAYYGVGLQGIHLHGQLILTLRVWLDQATNSVSLTDSSPLSGCYYGYRDASVNSSPKFYWDNLIVSSWESQKGSVFLLR